MNIPVQYSLEVKHTATDYLTENFSKILSENTIGSNSDGTIEYQLPFPITFIRCTLHVDTADLGADRADGPVVPPGL